MSLLRKDSLSVEDYCLKMKVMANKLACARSPKLACASSPLSEKDLISQILNGLGLGYLDVATFQLLVLI